MTDDTTTDDTTIDDTASRDDSGDRRRLVRERYGTIADTDADAPGCCEPTCCDDDTGTDELESALEGENEGRSIAEARSRDVGYQDVDLESAPDSSNLGLGCGNPVAIAELEPGETVLDLGSGGGFDAFIAAREVGSTGRVLGVDMTPSMIERARANAHESDLENVEFRLGEIEHVPVADESVDVVISNCVVNLSPEKSQVYAEAGRVLRPGGRLSVSDLVTTEPLPAAVREDSELIAGCIGGAATIEEHRSWLDAAGFEAIDVVVEGEWDAEHDGEALPIVSARIEARAPARSE